MAEHALDEDPKLVYGTPEKLLEREDLTRKQKLAILEAWELDARNLQVAEEENMAGGEHSMLHRVLKARHRLEGDAK
jgi:hypothetical protein